MTYDIYSLDFEVLEGDSSVRLKLYLKNSRQKMHVGESTSTTPFQVKTRPQEPHADAGVLNHWTWQIKVFPRGQFQSEQNIQVYVILLGCGQDVNESHPAEIKFDMSLMGKRIDTTMAPVRKRLDPLVQRGQWAVIPLPLYKVKKENVVDMVIRFTEVGRPRHTFGSVH